MKVLINPTNMDSIISVLKFLCGKFDVELETYSCDSGEPKPEEKVEVLASAV
jgi:hypothetical protein